MNESERAQIRRDRMLEASASRRNPTEHQLKISASGRKGKQRSSIWTAPLHAKRRGTDANEATA